MEEAGETTSDFYQVPITGGIPVKLTFEKRPFTPPFAQLIKMQSCANSSRGHSRQTGKRTSIVEEKKEATENAYESGGHEEQPIEEEIESEL